MNKTVLLASAAVLALSVGGASAKPAHPGVAFKGTTHQVIFKTPKGSKTLYDQSEAGSGEAIDSQNFESTFAAYDDAGADDFTVPSGHKWTVKEVDAPGLYYNGYGPATSENVIFYKDSGGHPGAVTKKGERDNLSGTDNAGSYAIDLTNGGATKGVKLGAGHYWVSVVANCSFTGGCGQHGWSTDSTLHGTGAQWQNPGGGFGVCPTWGPITTCISGNTDPDFQFTLKGKDKS